MITEDVARPLEPGAALANTHILRRLPIVSELYVNPVSVRLKAEQEARVAQIAAPKDNPWLAQLITEYVGKFYTTMTTFAYLTYSTLQIKAAKRVIPAGRLLRNLAIWKTTSFSWTSDT